MATNPSTLCRLLNGYANYPSRLLKPGLRRAAVVQARDYTAEQRAKTRANKKHVHCETKVMGIEMLRDPRINKVILIYLENKSSILHSLLMTLIVLKTCYDK